MLLVFMIEFKKAMSVAIEHTEEFPVAESGVLANSNR